MIYQVQSSDKIWISDTYDDKSLNKAKQDDLNNLL
jgi:hypothetical protein